MPPAGAGSRQGTTPTASSGAGDGRYRAASITKTLVATVVLQLAEESRLELSDTVDS
ncbi:serine hydrolase [Actinocrispum sp. NPDC049592]|uniref:serine hydrolase n=1 Tax=Actinocrispum sp. NPDC049592 TaxID=3154835 RepID=UPI00343FFF71